MDSSKWTKDELRNEFERLTGAIINSPYEFQKWIERACFFRSSDYHDLAIGDLYKALLLIDDALDSSGEYHVQALRSLKETTLSVSAAAGDDPISEELTLALRRHALECYQGLVECLLGLGTLQDAYRFCERGLALDADHSTLQRLRQHIVSENSTEAGEASEKLNVEGLPAKNNARRELYPWDGHEPDRYTVESIDSLNSRLKSVAPALIVRAVDLPVLQEQSEGSVKQLGLFAKEKIKPGTTVLREKSLLAVNNRLHDELCDACSSELPKDPSESFACEECGTAIFCSQDCLNQASSSYHSAVCDNEDFEAINKDVDITEATDALYGLLLGRAICMSETQSIHPLDLAETRFLWGDYSPWIEPPRLSDQPPQRPRALPWSFEYNIADPIHLLETLDLDIYASIDKYDFWILNTLFAKFRGVANARMDPRTGKPEVAAVHPLWCLANHSCSPNVTWEWGGEIRMWARDGAKDEIVRWGDEAGDEERWRGGLQAGDEVFNHYCDIRLPVRERREWAAGALGGACMCVRCVWESSQSQK